jgi:hypothetical protein
LAPGEVPLQFALLHIEAQAVLTDVETFDIVVAAGEGRVVPCVALVLPKLDGLDGLELSVLLVGQETLQVHAFMFVVLLVLGLLLFSLLGLLLQRGLIHYLIIRGLYPIPRYPLVHSSVEALIVHIVIVGRLTLLLLEVVILGQSHIDDFGPIPSPVLHLGLNVVGIIQSPFVLLGADDVGARGRSGEYFSLTFSLGCHFLF